MKREKLRWKSACIITIVIALLTFNPFRKSREMGHYSSFNASLVSSSGISENAFLATEDQLTQSTWDILLNPKTKEVEWQLPPDYQVYQHDREMYEIVLKEDRGEIKDCPDV